MSWKKIELGEVVTLQRGYDLTEKERRTGKVPVVSSSGISGYHDEAKVKGPGVVTGRYGTLGQVYYITDNFWPHNTTLFVKDFHGNDVRFAYYLLSSLNLGSQSAVSAVPGVNRNTLHRLPVLCPPPPIQRRIGEILGRLDDKIEVNRRINRTLEAMAQALYQHWFVDFGPFQDGGFVESELGLIPQGWRVVSLAEAYDINPLRSLRRGQLAPYLDMANMPTSSARALSWIYREFNSGMRFINGDVLVARITPCLENGKTAYVDFLENGQVGWGSTEYIVLRSKLPLPLEHAYLFARTKEFRSHAIQQMTGTSGRQRVSSDRLKTYQVVVPPEEIANLFGERIKNSFKVMKQLDQESAKLIEIRDYLLPKLLSGEIPAEAAMAEI